MFSARSICANSHVGSISSIKSVVCLRNVALSEVARALCIILVDERSCASIIQSDRKLAAERKDVEDKEKALRSQLAGLSIAREEAQLEKWNATERKEMEEIRKQVAHEMRRDQHGHDKLQSWAWEMQARDTFGDLTATRKCALQDLEVELPKMQALAAKVRSCGPCAVLIPIAKQQCRHPAHLPSSHILNC